MSSATEIALRLIEEGTKARAHFQIWWAFRNVALPKYLPVMNDPDLVDFFHAANSGNYTLFFLALTKVFDRDSRVAGISELKRALRKEGKTAVALGIARDLKPVEPHIKSLMNIRNRSLVHNEADISRQRVYKINGITPNQLRSVIDAACGAINDAASALSIGSSIPTSDRNERAALKLLERLDRVRP